MSKHISTSPLLTKDSFPSPARLARGGFGNEAGVRENHYAFTVTNHLFFRTLKVFPALAARSARSMAKPSHQKKPNVTNIISFIDIK
jgi:hypothetical protein